jgi:hypothetical protein
LNPELEGVIVGATLSGMALVREDLSETLLDQLAAEASRDAIHNLQQRGINVFYVENDLEVLEQPDGSRFEIEFTHVQPGAYRIVRSLPNLL